MSPTELRLDQALSQILDHVGDLLDTARNDGLLTDLRAIVRGERSRVRPDPPYLWVMVGAATCTDARALHESWQVALMLNAFVHSEDPEEGWMDAMFKAARARSVVLRDRTFGSDLPFVEDAQSAELGPLGQFTAGRRFGAYARINVRFALVEPSGEPS
ncbi:MAG: hypothetical protein ACLFRD_08635 [Nitriliruptoraceae bacterium]